MPVESNPLLILFSTRDSSRPTTRRRGCLVSCIYGCDLVHCRLLLTANLPRVSVDGTLPQLFNGFELSVRSREFRSFNFDDLSFVFQIVTGIADLPFQPDAEILLRPQSGDTE